MGLDQGALWVNRSFMTDQAFALLVMSTVALRSHCCVPGTGLSSGSLSFAPFPLFPGLFSQGRFRHRIASEYSEWRFFGCTGRAPARGRHRLLTEYTVAPPGGCPTMISLLSFWQALSRGFCDDCDAFLWRVGFCDDCDTFPSGVGIGVSFTRGG